jgi:hypothetical protein
MDKVAGGMPGSDSPAKMRRVCGSLTYKDKGWRLEKRFEIFNGIFERSRRIKHPWVSHDP